MGFRIEASGSHAFRILLLKLLKPLKPYRNQGSGGSCLLQRISESLDILGVLGQAKPGQRTLKSFGV